MKKVQKKGIIFFVNAFTKLGEKDVESMPKIIEGAREKILANARIRLFENGYQHLSLREVAKESGIATGTIYNYFANKDYLIANIMLEDWEIVAKRMDRHIETASSVKDGIFGICDAINEFAEIYANIWKQPSVAAAATPDRKHRREFLTEQLLKRISLLLEKNGYGEKREFDYLIIELILAAAGNEKVKEQFGNLLEQLYP